MTRLAADEKQV